MCTVVIEVTSEPEPGGVRLLAIRDEDPARPWDPVGPWWPQTHPGAVGVRDRRAGGAWLAAQPEEGRLAVLLNRGETAALPDDRIRSRGSLALDAIAGRIPAEPQTHGFNLLDIGPSGARVLSWDGIALRETPIPPGVHMIAHDDLDDPATARIARWLPEFRARSRAASAAEWPTTWLELLPESAQLPATDDRALIRDNRPHGYPTLSLLYCLAAVGPDGVELHDVTLPEPGRWPTS